MLLGEERNDSRMQRSQMIGFVLVALIMSASLYFFPPTPPQPPAATPAAVEQKPAEPASPVAALPAAAIAPEQLPPVADTVPQGESDELTLQNTQLKLVFTKIGARLKSATVVLGDQGENSQQIVPPAKDGELDKDRVLPLGLRFSPKYLGDALDQRRWSAQVDANGQGVTFSIELPGQAKIEKRFTLAEASHVLKTEIGYTNTSAAAQALGSDDHDPAFALNWGPGADTGDTNKTKSAAQPQEIIWKRGAESTVTPITELKNETALKDYARWLEGTEWLALSSTYFVVAMKPEFEGAPNWAQGDKDQLRFGSGVPHLEAKPGEKVSRSYQVYIGPKEKHALRGAWPGLDSLWTFYHTFMWSASLGHFMDVFSKILLGILVFLHDHVIANYGIGIIILTLLVRGIMFPLTLKQMKSMKQMQKLQPEMEALKAKHKDNPQEQQRALMELYRERGINPVAGCFPLLLQMPVFFALYRMLWTAIELRREPFFGWIHDLSEPDRLFVFAQPIPLLVGNLHSINLLPLILAVVMWASTKIMATSGPMTSPEQKMMMNIMPVMFSVFCYEQASGLSLYIITSTLLGMAQSKIVNKIDWDVDVSKKTVKAGPQSKSWYEAALEKKKQLEKEQREFKKTARSGGLEVPKGEGLREKLEKLIGEESSSDQRPGREPGKGPGKNSGKKKK